MRRSIKKIITTLRNTELNYTKSVLKAEGLCKYCAEGVLLKGIVPDEDLEQCVSIETVIAYNEDIIDVRERIRNAYGIDITSCEYDNPITCPFCDKYRSLSYLEDVIIHMNDVHSSSHKATAKYIEELARQYDLVTGKEL